MSDDENSQDTDPSAPAGVALELLPRHPATLLIKEDHAVAVTLQIFIEIQPQLYQLFLMQAQKPTNTL